MIHGGKTFRLGPDGISAGKQVRRGVCSGVIGDQSAGDASFHVNDRHGSSGYDVTRLVRDSSKNASRISLREQWKRKKQCTNTDAADADRKSTRLNSSHVEI